MEVSENIMKPTTKFWSKNSQSLMCQKKSLIQYYEWS